jgi:hypothetical protein
MMRCAAGEPTPREPNPPPSDPCSIPRRTLRRTGEPEQAGPVLLLPCARRRQRGAARVARVKARLAHGGYTSGRERGASASIYKGDFAGAFVRLRARGAERGRRETKTAQAATGDLVHRRGELERSAHGEQRGAFPRAGRNRRASGRRPSNSAPVRCRQTAGRKWRRGVPRGGGGRRARGPGRQALGTHSRSYDIDSPMLAQGP